MAIFSLNFHLSKTEFLRKHGVQKYRAVADFNGYSPGETLDVSAKTARDLGKKIFDVLPDNRAGQLSVKEVGGDIEFVDPKRGRTTRTDSDGTRVLTNISLANYEIRAVERGYEEARRAWFRGRQKPT